MMEGTLKMLVTGVGGQGVVLFTDLMVEAAVLAGIPVSTSEIYGLAQRGGSVTSGITFGEHTYGFLEKGGADILVGLEPLEAQRAATYLHRGSTAIIDNNRIYPYLVNAGNAEYPDVDRFLAFLEKSIARVIFVNEDLGTVKPAVRNLYVLGRLSEVPAFPIAIEYLETAIHNIVTPAFLNTSLQAFGAGRKQESMA